MQSGLVMGADIPFESHEGLIWVQVSVPQSPRPLNFLLDSGAGVSVIHLGTARRLGLVLGERVKVGGVDSAADGFWPQRLSARAGDVVLPSEYLAVDLGKLGQACACGVDGLLGLDFFRKRVVQIDYQTRTIRLLASSPATNDAEVVALKFRRQAILAPLRVNGGPPQWMRLDTGCTAALHWVAGSAPGAASHNRVSVGLAEISLSETTASVQLGQTTFPSLPASLHERPIFPGEAGLLGNGLLARFDRVTFDAKAGRLLLHRLRANP